VCSGNVDAIVVDGPSGKRVFTLQSPDEPYRILVERMNEGAATLTREGIVLFSNQRLAEMVGFSPGRLPGSSFFTLLRKEDRPAFSELMRRALTRGVRADIHLVSGTTLLPVRVSLCSVPLENSDGGICLIAADLSEQRRAEEAHAWLAAVV
jgi:PAS domain S-box-containing protein